ncbi:MAG: FadR/GntR family transcriptional regulator, partial [Haemophilus parainfluenzae]
DHNQLINILDIREILEYGFAPMVLGKISQEQTALLQKSVANMEKNAREQKFSPKDEYHIHLKLYEPLNNPLLIQYLDAFWQIYQQVEKDLPPPILSPEKLAMQHRELIDAVEAHDLVRMQRAILQYFQSIRQRLQQGGHDAN